MEFLGHRRAADDVPALDKGHPQSPPREVEGAHQRVVARAYKDGIVNILGQFVIASNCKDEPTLGGIEGKAKARKQFFFEKKNQKTFVLFGRRRIKIGTHRFRFFIDT
jgi:hypothetical protein